MQLIHTTVTWAGPVPTAVDNHKRALASWTQHAWPPHYRPAHFHPSEFNITAKSIGDPEPHVLLAELIDRGFAEGKNDDDVVLLANSDVRLKAGAWNYAHFRALRQQPSYEAAIDHGTKKITDHLWQPQSFWIPKKWWASARDRMPPIWFPSPWWEPVMYHLFGALEGIDFNLPQCTSHIPHARAHCIDDRTNPTVRWNYSVQFGWYRCGFHKPHGMGRIKVKYPKLPDEFHDGPMPPLEGGSIGSFPYLKPPTARSPAPLP